MFHAEHLMFFGRRQKFPAHQYRINEFMSFRMYEFFSIVLYDRKRKNLQLKSKLILIF